MNEKPLLEDKYFLDQDLRDSKQENTKLKVIIDGMQKDVSDLKDEKKKLTEESISAQTQKNELEAENKKLAEGTTALQTKHDELQMEKGGLVENLQTLKVENDKVVQGQKIAIDETANLKLEVQKLQRDNLRLRKELDSEVSDAQAYTTELDDLNTSLESELTRFKRRELSPEMLLFHRLCLADLCLSKLNKSSCSRAELRTAGFPMQLLHGDDIEGIKTSNYELLKNGDDAFKIRQQ